jgi:FMN phosphatase YigB (HAD superfamily)
MSKESVIVTDVENTLFDWLEMWICGFDAMLFELVKIFDREDSVVKQSIRRANQILGTSERDEVVLHLDFIDSVARERNARTLLEIAERFRGAKAAATRLYPEILSTLDCLRGRGFRIVCLTESVRPYAVARISQLGLDGHIDLLVCQEFSDTTESLFRTPETFLQHTQIMTFEPDFKKSNPRLLIRICDYLGFTCDRDRLCW